MSLHQLLIDVVTSPEVRRAAVDDLEALMDQYQLDASERDVIHSSDRRLLGALAAALDLGDNSTPAQPTPEAGNVRDLPSAGPTSRLRLRVQPALQADGSVSYAAAIYPDTDEPPAGALPEMPGQVMHALETLIDLQPVYSPIEGGATVSVVQTVHTVGPRAVLGSRAPLAPDVWGHQASGPTQSIAHAVLAGEQPLAELISAVRGGPSAPPVALPAGPTDLYIVGTGIQAGVHLTPQAQEALAAVEQVFYVDNGVGMHEVLRQLNPNVVPLFGSVYEAGKPRLQAYERMCAEVVGATLEGKSVAFAMFGHPLVGVYSPFLIEDVARLLGKRVEVLPAVSAFDTLCADLRFDPCVQGVQMFEATELLLRRRALDPEVPAVIWQVGAVETRLYNARPSHPDRFRRFVAHLLRTYPSDHPVTLYFGASHPLQRPLIRATPLASLPEAAADLHPGVTLFLPAVGLRALHDTDLMDRLDDPAWLAYMTRDA